MFQDEERFWRSERHNDLTCALQGKARGNGIGVSSLPGVNMRIFLFVCTMVFSLPCSMVEAIGVAS